MTRRLLVSPVSPLLLPLPALLLLGIFSPSLHLPASAVSLSVTADSAAQWCSVSRMSRRKDDNEETAAKVIAGLAGLAGAIGLGALLASAVSGNEEKRRSAGARAAAEASLDSQRREQDAFAQRQQQQERRSLQRRLHSSNSRSSVCRRRPLHRCLLSPHGRQRGATAPPSLSPAAVSTSFSFLSLSTLPPPAPDGLLQLRPGQMQVRRSVHVPARV